MTDNLQFWRKLEWLSIYDAALLLCDVNPSNNFALDKNDIEIYELERKFYTVGAPEAFESALTLLLDHVKKDQQSLSSQPSDETIFKEVQFKNGHASGGINPSTEVRMKSLIDWYVKNEYDSDFFTVQAEKYGHEKKPTKPEYQTKLMSIMYETIERYYGENYDPDNPDTISKQRDIEDWLQETYSLSGRQADAIYVLTKPDHHKNPQGKK